MSLTPPVIIVHFPVGLLLLCLFLHIQQELMNFISEKRCAPYYLRSTDGLSFFICFTTYMLQLKVKFNG